MDAPAGYTPYSTEAAKTLSRVSWRICKVERQVDCHGDEIFEISWPVFSKTAVADRIIASDAEVGTHFKIKIAQDFYVLAAEQVEADPCAW